MRRRYHTLGPSRSPDRLLPNPNGTLTVGEGSTQSLSDTPVYWIAIATGTLLTPPTVTQSDRAAEVKSAGNLALI